MIHFLLSALAMIVFLGGLALLLIAQVVNDDSLTFFAVVALGGGFGVLRWLEVSSRWNRYH